MTESPPMDSGFAVPVFSTRDDPIACINKAMAFLTVIASSRWHGHSATSLEETRSKLFWYWQCTHPKRPKNAAWYKEKSMLAEAQEVGQILDKVWTKIKPNQTKPRAELERAQKTEAKVKVQLAFLADPGIPHGQAVQTIIPNNVAFQTEDLDTYDSEYDDISNAKAVLMANISNYGSDVILEVPHSETYLNDMENQSVHVMQDFEQTSAMDFKDNEIHSDTDSNIIPYS
ncbi:hypothetical protein Tco_0736730 [Tanacetum coccineum]